MDRGPGLRGQWTRPPWTGQLECRLVTGMLQLPAEMRASATMQRCLVHQVERNRSLGEQLCLVMLRPGTGPVMGSPDTKVGCLGARVEGSDPQAPDCCPGVMVGAVVERVSSSLAVGTVAPPLALGQATPPTLGYRSSSGSLDSSYSYYCWAWQLLPLCMPCPSLQLLPQQRLRWLLIITWFFLCILAVNGFVSCS
ncbi:UNVERIFIED_CONTAM: hypothetical protein FKN15_043680 [Acipenser sinensis]